MEIVSVDNWDDKHNVLIDYMTSKMDNILKNVSSIEDK